MAEYRLPKYEQICTRCGHTAGYHTLHNCAWLYRSHGQEADCDCPGWIKDPNWPPPIIIREQ